MEVIHPRCCGIDVHKATVCACISIKDGDRIEKQKRRFDTTTAQLRELAARGGTGSRETGGTGKGNAS